MCRRPSVAGSSVTRPRWTPGGLQDAVGWAGGLHSPLQCPLQQATRMVSLLKDFCSVRPSCSSVGKAPDLQAWGRAGFPRSGKSQGKINIFQGQGKVREFCKRRMLVKQ